MLVMLEVGRRNEVALAVTATAAASRPAQMRCWRAACIATGMATTTATSRLASPLTTAVNARTEAAATARGARSRISRPARMRNTPSRSASTDPAMIAARVANGPRVARAAGGRASGRRQAAAAVRMTAAVHSTTGSQSRGDVILADTSGLLDAIVGMPPRMWMNLLVADDGGSNTARL